MGFSHLFCCCCLIRMLHMHTQTLTHIYSLRAIYVQNEKLKFSALLSGDISFRKNNCRVSWYHLSLTMEFFRLFVIDSGSNCLRVGDIVISTILQQIQADLLSSNCFATRAIICLGTPNLVYFRFRATCEHARHRNELNVYIVFALI